ncbi:MAG: heavy-metal-associated domain-containing protein [Actinomycetia bacterium]|jgi:copper chaperone|nr:heavy-metal-associated domain-containing protein [Actinomycetes bacterium]MCP4843956.1 heavy-metal-associated domain-containing protein [Actinomycetes bacterium]MDP6241175.1 heavy-metal-associated domain-containing protein [Acidimicrobiales bacterium]MDP6876873.1 heavy-metal-associated domain-containing protein [Alphaproteobacteria bacterium]MEE1565310.1 heavy-metal-associated domain-containing protein [Acidimicrobiales bacterium]|tara:strand:- start:1904 stop:2131 length:228 start_codon:yes stop_codon:yes gene_type:complete
MTTRVFHVPDISCVHCKRAIEEALGEVPEVTSAVVTVDRRDVEVDGAVSDEAVIAAIGKAGYDVALDDTRTAETS